MDKVVNNDSNKPEEKDAIPSHIFIPIFSVLGVAIICAIITLIILLRRDSRRHLRQRARRAGRRATKMFSPSSSKRSQQSRTGGGTLNKSTVEELSYHLPSNRQRPAPPRRNPSLLHTTQSGATSPSDAMFNTNNNNNMHATNLKPKRNRRDRSRPTTGNSAYSETFMRPWSWRKPAPVLTTMINTPSTMCIASKLSPTRLLSTPKAATKAELGAEDGAPAAPTFWVEEQHPAGNMDKQDVEWQPPTDWDIAGPITGGNITAPAVPMPAFLKPHVPVDPRSIDPSSFPLPMQDQVGPLGRWSSSQRSSFGHPGGQHLSVGADSMFCTCDLDGIMEEDDEAYHQAFGSSRGHETPRVSMSGSSIHAGTSKCRACTRRSAAANAIAIANHNNSNAQQPNSPTSTLFSRASSIRKSRRKRKQEISPSSKIAVAGRLYKEG